MENAEDQSRGQRQPEAARIFDRVTGSPTTLFIKRIPLPTRQAFIELAEKDFCGDYGMLIKWLMDDILGKDFSILATKITEHENRIFALETNISAQKNSPVPVTQGVKMLDGTTRRIEK